LPLPAWALTANFGITQATRRRRYDLTIGYSPIRIDGRKGISTGFNGPLIIDPKDGEPFAYDLDYPVVLSDWSFEDPETIFLHINLVGHYYDFQRRTVWDFFNDIGERGFADTVADRTAWGRMRMSPVDLADVTAYTYTYLMNGHSPDMNWTALFNPGETIRLRFINASTTTNYDVRIPGLDMEVVMADGKAVGGYRHGGHGPRRDGRHGSWQDG